MNAWQNSDILPYPNIVANNSISLKRHFTKRRSFLFPPF